MDNADGKPVTADWPKAADYRKSIRVEMALFTSVLLFLLMGAAGLFLTVKIVRDATRAVAETLVIQARSYSGPAGKLILGSDEPDALLLNDICRTLGEDNPDVHWAGIADRDGQFIAHTDLRKVMASTRVETPRDRIVFDFLRSDEALGESDDTLYLMTPITEGGLQVGWLHLAASTHSIESARKASILTVATITLTFMLVGVPWAWFAMNRKLRPLVAITQGIRDLDLDTLAFNVPLRTRNELGYLAATLHTMGRKLHAARHAAREQERMAHELEIAHQIQMSILPRQFPSGPRFEFAGAYRSAREVGGDYYDFISLDPRRLGIIVADVSGKSLPGMLVMLMTRDLVKTAAKTLSDPAALLSRVNLEISPSLQQQTFVTMYYGILDIESGVLRFASAGHNALLWVRDGGRRVEAMRPPGYPLGMMPPKAFDLRIKTSEIQLAPGDWIIQYTDGINEAQNAEGEEFGMERFTARLVESAALNAKGLVDSFMACHDGFVAGATPYDDITLLALKWAPGTREPAFPAPETLARVS